MKESSSCRSPQQPSPRPSSTIPASSQLEVLSDSTSQVEVISRALSTASTLGRVRRDSLAISDPPVARQVLERSLKRNLDRRLNQISFLNTAQESSQETLDSQLQTQFPENSPRTSSPFQHLAPGTPISPSTSFDSVFFPDTPVPPAPIQPPSLDILIFSRKDLSVTPIPSEPLLPGTIMSSLQEKEAYLKTLCRRITANMEANPISILSEEEMIPLYKDTEKQLVALLVDLNVGAQEIFEENSLELGENKINTWKAKLETVKNKLSSYRQELAAEVKKIKQASGPGPPTSDSLSNSRSVNATINSTLEQERLNLEREKQRKQEDKIRTEAESRLTAVLEDTKRFAKKFPSMAENWTLEDNFKIETAMREITNWEKQMNQLIKESREVEILVRGNNLSDSDNNVENMKQLVTSTQKVMDNSIRQVQHLDKARNLNSLGTRKTEPVKFSQFSGRPGDDFVTFKRKVEKAFSSNRVPTDDQVEKLRENLRDGAKLVVPEDTENIERAWELLGTAFGGEDKVMQNRKDKLLSMGSLPEAGVLNKGGQSKRITWCLELERALAEIVELGNRNDELAREAFSKSSTNLVIGLFPSDIRRDMIRASGEGSDKLLAIIDIIEAERAIFQEDEQFVEKKAISGRQGSRPSGNGSGHAVNISATSNLPNPRGYQTYRGPTRMPSCRICKSLETRGDTAELYENHLGNYATGCPRYATMPLKKDMRLPKRVKCASGVLIQNQTGSSGRDIRAV